MLRERNFRHPTPEEISDIAINLGRSSGQRIIFKAEDVFTSTTFNPRANKANKVRWPGHDSHVEIEPVRVQGIVESVEEQEINQYFDSPKGLVVNIRDASAKRRNGEIAYSHESPMTVRLDRIDPKSIKAAREFGKLSKFIKLTRKLLKFV